MMGHAGNRFHRPQFVVVDRVRFKNSAKLLHPEYAQLNTPNCQIAKRIPDV